MVKNAIKVYARVKPERSRKNIVNYQIHHRPNEDSEEDFLSLMTPTLKSKDYPDNRPEAWNFSFFQIFEESATQENLFKNVAQPVVESALDGYNGTVFAYGQTASGKTYSISGKQEKPEYLGIVPRSLLYLFDMIQKRPENVYSIEVAYLEIYNESGYDLLDRNFSATRFEDLPRITVQEDEIGRLHLKNLTFHCVGSAEDAFELFLVGDQNRVTVETPMNSESSRSHCIFTIVICMKKFGEEEYKRAKVHLVDLAGSERVYKCSISGTILTEAKHINLSLHYLEQVIVCLGQESTGHIPYRNSILTSVLRDSLGGNCLTVMLATISVAADNLEETISTCKFAQRVALIKNDVKLVVEKDVYSENALLRLENEKLRQRIKEMTKEIKIETISAEDKRNLDHQIRNFLESNEPIDVDNNPKKIEYCFESFKRIFDFSKDTNSCLKKLEYYKDLVIQRDKEISLLIDLIKKEGKKGTEVAGEEGSDEEHLEDAVKTSVVSNSNQIKTNVESNGQVEPYTPLNFHISRDLLQANNKINISASKVPDETDDSVSSHINKILYDISLIKLKTRTKAAKSLSQRNIKANFDRNINTDVENSETINHTNLAKQVSINKSVSNNVSKPNLLPCNVVDLTLNNSTETEETNQQTSHKKQRKKARQVEIKSSKKKIAESSSVRPEIEKTEVPSLEPKNPPPVYQRFLSFNVPKNLNDSVTNNFTEKKSINRIIETQNRNKINIGEQYNTPKLNCKPYIDPKLKLESKVALEMKHSSDRSTERPNIDQKVYSKTIDVNLRHTNDGSDSRRDAEQVEKEVKESHEQSARSNACSFRKMDSSRSKTDEKRTSISSFTVNYPEKSYVFDEQTSARKAKVGQTFNYDTNRSLEGSLPLTGDPEIDEEIIAFYKAKRSGEMY